MTSSVMKMNVSLDTRHDSLSPKVEPHSKAMTDALSHTSYQGMKQTFDTTQYTFITTKASDYDKKFAKITHPKISDNVSPRMAPAESRDWKRLPSLAATHPAMYQKGPSVVYKREMPQPPPYPGQHRIKKERSDRVAAATVEKPLPLPWQIYVDPKRLSSQVPAFHDPKLRMLKMDVEQKQPRVISPVLMIGLPCGDMVEAAHVYCDDKQQPRDSPNS